MAYIRVKTINKSPYAYLVESTTTSAGPRQKVKQYLGKIITIAPSSTEKEMVSHHDKTVFLSQLLQRELQRHDFQQEKDNFIFEQISVSPAEWIVQHRKNQKEIVLGVNNGFLCSYTLQRLVQFKKTKNFTTDAHTLAKYFLEAGLPLSREEFVQYYQLL